MIPAGVRDGWRWRGSCHKVLAEEKKKILEKWTVSRNHVSGFTSACFHIIMLA